MTAPRWLLLLAITHLATLPFTKLFDGDLGADPARAVELMGDDWLRRNRSPVLEQLGRQAGTRAVDRLPEALRLLRAEGERKQLLESAVEVARAEDLAQWLEAIETGGLQVDYGELAAAVLDVENGETLLAEVEGTPAEEGFQARWRELSGRPNKRPRVPQ